MIRLPHQAAAHLSAAALALMVTLGTLATLDTLAQGPASRSAEAGLLVKATPAQPQG